MPKGFVIHQAAKTWHLSTTRGQQRSTIVNGNPIAKEASLEESLEPVVNASISHWKGQENRNDGPDRFRASVPGNNKTGNKQQGLVKGSDLTHPCVLESPWRWLTSLIMVADRGLFIWMSDKSTVAGVSGTELLMGI